MRLKGDGFSICCLCGWLMRVVKFSSCEDSVNGGLWFDEGGERRNWVVVVVMKVFQWSLVMIQGLGGGAPRLLKVGGRVLVMVAIMEVSVEGQRCWR
ncbi:hypothetical protein V6N11_001234 [Hibiscus sabdariffa]|uniref:Transmembrane protein n=1 Tax=Hibiscus sabdariffa TaxID=183260 RepID=A0ABR2RZ61_9ROSI